MARVLFLLSAVLVVVGCVVVGGCGGDDDVPVSASDVVGTWVLDKEATKAAAQNTLKLVTDNTWTPPQPTTARPVPAWVVLDDDGFREDLTRMIASIERDEYALTWVLQPDGRWTMRSVWDGKVEENAGTWTRDGKYLVIEEPADWFTSTASLRQGKMEVRCPYGCTVFVLNRVSDEPAR